MCKGVDIALIMAGGEGNRMNPLSKYYPKCCLPIYDEPLLIKQIKWLKNSDIKKLILAIDRNSSYIVRNLILNSGINDNIDIEFNIEDEAKGLGYSLLQQWKVIGNKPFIFLLGDEYFEQPKFFKHVSEINVDKIILGAVKYSNKELILNGCNFEVDESKLTILKLIEKPALSEIKSSWCWSGGAVFNEQIFLALEDECRKSIKPSNKDLVESINRIIMLGENIYYYVENSVNINLTYIEDYYKAFKIEFNKKSMVN